MAAVFYGCHFVHFLALAAALAHVIHKHTLHTQTHTYTHTYAHTYTHVYT